MLSLNYNCNHNDWFLYYHILFCCFLYGGKDRFLQNTYRNGLQGTRVVVWSI